MHYIQLFILKFNNSNSLVLDFIKTSWTWDSNLRVMNFETRPHLNIRPLIKVSRIDKTRDFHDTQLSQSWFEFSEIWKFSKKWLSRDPRRSTDQNQLRRVNQNQD